MAEFESSDLPPIRFIPFDRFQAHGTIPRCPDQAYLCVHLSDIDLKNSLLVFVSHCWLRGYPGAEGYDGRPHPDNAKGGKYELIVEGVKDMLSGVAKGHGENCYLWLDFSCIDQNADPAGELKQLDKIVEACDCVFTPVYDENHASWSFRRRITNWFDGLRSAGWTGTPHSYLNRAWCRVEMFFGANIPLKGDSKKFLFQREEMRRPHFLYGSKFEANGIGPVMLPPLQNKYFEKYNPEIGNLTKEADRIKIHQLVKELEPYMKGMKIGYDEDLNENCQQKYIFSDGSIYEGEWKRGKHHGTGTFRFADGNCYSGEWNCGKKHGFGKYSFADGTVYEGEWRDDMIHGRGKCWYIGGDSYDGEWKDGKQHGKGSYVFQDGSTFEGDWSLGKCTNRGRSVLLNGEVVQEQKEICSKDLVILAQPLVERLDEVDRVLELQMWLPQVSTRNIKEHCVYYFIKKPPGIELNIWLASHAADYYGAISMMWNSILTVGVGAYAVGEGFPPGFEYRWADSAGVRPKVCSGPQYVSYVLDWIEEEISNEQSFPPSLDIPFPVNFTSSVKQIFTRLFRVVAIIMVHHYHKLDEYELVHSRELDALSDLVQLTRRNWEEKYGKKN